jgi:hypothetical protein
MQLLQWKPFTARSLSDASPATLRIGAAPIH